MAILLIKSLNAWHLYLFRLRHYRERVEQIGGFLFWMQPATATLSPVVA
jgi:hypothetical protein